MSKWIATLSYYSELPSFAGILRPYTSVHSFMILINNAFVNCFHLLHAQHGNLCTPRSTLCKLKHSNGMGRWHRRAGGEGAIERQRQWKYSWALCVIINIPCVSAWLPLWEMFSSFKSLSSMSPLSFYRCTTCEQWWEWDKVFYMRGQLSQSLKWPRRGDRHCTGCAQVLTLFMVNLFLKCVLLHNIVYWS